MRVILGVAIASAAVSPAAADRAFCNVTPCDPREIKTRTLDKDLAAGPVTCKKGKEAGEDAQQRVVYCTTARAATVDGMVVKAGAYTLFHANGKIYQTTIARPFERTLADGSKLGCAADLVSLEPTGALTYCKLGKPRVATPRPRVGEGIALFPDGKLRGYTLDEPYTAAGIAMVPGSSVSFDEQGRVIGGRLKDPAVVGALTLDSEFQLWPNGKLRTIYLDQPAKIQGHEFPARAQLAFRADGTLEAAEYVEKQGFMIHGEPWSDTRFMTFDRKGKVLTTRVEHFQAKESPAQFRERWNRGRKP